MNITRILFIISLLTTMLLFQHAAKAQDLTGIVYELESSHPVWNATIKNLRTQEEVLSNKDGQFKIPTQLNDYLTLDAAGYQIDTLFIYELGGIKRVYLVRDDKSIVLDEVVIKRLTDSRLALEIARAKNEGKAIDASQNRGGLRISPSRLFGRNAKNARKNLDILVEEQNNRKVDTRFTTRLVQSLTPLTEEEIPLFKERFRPTWDFVQLASPEELRIYILDSYKKFKQEE